MKILFLFLLAVALIAGLLYALPLPTSSTDFLMAGSQPNKSGTLDVSNQCLDCHGNYDRTVEPNFLWSGSMMAQSARDPLFYAALVIANQDAGSGGDMCIRCHSPKGWLEGRSSPADASKLTADDRDGVTCTACHSMIKPIIPNQNPYPKDSLYTNNTYPTDKEYSAKVEFIPVRPGAGQYVLNAEGGNYRGPYSQMYGEPSHGVLYSPFHREANFCGTCHDVSNPLYTRNAYDQYVPNLHNYAAPLKDFDSYMMFPIERTFSEWSASEYNSVKGVYAPQFGGNKSFVSTCQDCHMKTVTGAGCSECVKKRDDFPLHDLTGANTVVPKWVAEVYANEVDTAALHAGILRAEYLLKHAATMELKIETLDNHLMAKVKVINETGHKLPTGYGEGRRMWINLKAFDTENKIVYESGAYDSAQAVLKQDSTLKIYEIHHGITPATAEQDTLTAGPSFHFVLNDTTYFDNRIPPRGYNYKKFVAVQSQPVGYHYPDGQYWDVASYLLPNNTKYVEAVLCYQTASKEYIEFLKLENHTNELGKTVYDLWEKHGKSTPVEMCRQSLSLP